MSNLSNFEGAERSTMIITPLQAASILSVSTETVRQYVKRGLIRVVRTPGGQMRFRLCEVIRFQNERNNRSHVAAEAAEVDEEVLASFTEPEEPTLATLFEKNRFTFDNFGKVDWDAHSTLDCGTEKETK